MICLRSLFVMIQQVMSSQLMMIFFFVENSDYEVEHAMRWPIKRNRKTFDFEKQLYFESQIYHGFC